MPRKFLVTDTSTEIREYHQEIEIPDDKIIYDEDMEIAEMYFI